MKRVMGVDYGTKRVGIALSDPLRMTATGYETISWNGQDPAFLLDRMAEIIREKDVGEIVFGLPGRTDGRISESEQKARALGESLQEKTGIAPIFLDERYTTVIASRYLRDTGVKKDKKKQVIDQVAAEIILREYLETQRGSGSFMV